VFKDSNTIARVTELVIYPVKSLAGITVPKSIVEKAGLQFDRRWALVDLDGVVITAREYPNLLALTPSFADNALQVSDQSANTTSWPCNESAAQGAEFAMLIHGSEVIGFEVDPRVSRFFSDYLDEHCRLVCISNTTQRAVLERHGGEPGDTVAFADDCAVLLTNEGSLVEVNSHLSQDIPMRQLRPNIVVAGPAAFDEDDWSALSIGASDYKVAQKCKRCSLATTHPETCKLHPQQEPLATLAKTRPRYKNGVSFGLHLTPASQGLIKVGDELKLLPQKP